MGCTAEQDDCGDEEKPVHRVQVSDFEIGKYEVTQEVWEAIMGENLSRDQDIFEDCSQCPVENVSWNEVQAFLRQLNEVTGSKYRLPTEAEWEYAARGGQRSRGYPYAGSGTLGLVAWHDEKFVDRHPQSRNETHPIGQKQPNELGLYDMSGNVRRIAGTGSMWGRRVMGAHGRVGIVQRACCGAGHGSTNPGTSAPRTATGAPPGTRRKITASVWLGRSRPPTRSGGAQGQARETMERDARTSGAQSGEVVGEAVTAGKRTKRGLLGRLWSTGVGDRPLATGYWPLMLLVGVLWSVGSGVGLAEELSEAIRAHQYRLQASKALKEKDPQGAIRALEKFEKVASERQWEFLYLYGTLLATHGTTAEHIRKGHDLLIEAVNEIGEEGEPYFSSALEQLSVAETRLEALAEARRAGRNFRDCDVCPEMVVVPAGTYMMGEKGASDEKPVHQVTIAQPFAVGKYEVTFAEWEACVAGGGCNGYRPDDEGWGRGRRPVINVSWEDVQNYVRWLSEETGKPYRLLSEAEWEYVARAGKTTRYTWGDKKGRNRANCDGCGSRWDKKQPAPVGRFAANAFGLHDMHGNVWEWTQDCWNDNYRGAPSDGRAWQSGNCSYRVLRGGSWLVEPGDLRSAYRSWVAAGVRYNSIGCRLARTLTP